MICASLAQNSLSLRIHKGWGKGTSLHGNDSVFVCPGAQPNRVTLLGFLFYALFCSVTHTCYPRAWQAQQNQRDYVVSIWKYSTVITEHALGPSPPSSNKQVKHEREETRSAHLEPAPSKGASWLMGTRRSQGGGLVECSPHETCKQGDAWKDLGGRLLTPPRETFRPSNSRTLCQHIKTERDS